MWWGTGTAEVIWGLHRTEPPKGAHCHDSQLQLLTGAPMAGISQPGGSTPSKSIPGTTGGHHEAPDGLAAEGAQSHFTCIQLVKDQVMGQTSFWGQED